MKRFGWFLVVLVAGLLLGQRFGLFWTFLALALFGVGAWVNSRKGNGWALVRGLSFVVALFGTFATIGIFMGGGLLPGALAAIVLFGAIALNRHSVKRMAALGVS